MFLEMVEAAPDFDTIVARVAAELTALLYTVKEEGRITEECTGILLAAYDQNGSRFTMQPIMGSVENPILFFSCISFGFNSIALVILKHKGDVQGNCVVAFPKHADAVFSLNIGEGEYKRTIWFAIARNDEEDRVLGQEMAMHVLRSFFPDITVRTM